MNQIERKKLLVVDDIDMNRLILADLFSADYDVIEAENGEVALKKLEEFQEEIAVVLLDIIMPVLNGFGVLQRMNDSGVINSIPVILITGEDDDEVVLRAYALGVSDLINKPFNSEIVERRVENVISLYAHQRELESKLKEQREMLAKQAERLSQTNLFIIDALSATVEFRSLESGEHVKRVRVLTKTFLESVRDTYPFEDDEIEAISNASALHDMGKIAIPDAILMKPGRLTDEEFEIMKTHTTRGCEILSSLDYAQDPQYYKYCYEICRHHHERWDGRGYPDGIAGDEISIWAQAASLADVYDALTSKRVYKDAYTHEEAVKMILNGECGAFNPVLLDGFKRIQETLREQIKVRNPGNIVDAKH